ncbi:Modulator of FtsH protease HflK [Hartmannibacter diazotrophicus]|uniref:Protein HflK n=1 Tax=Hartmannibacter diazotrophicus TaxID=1482074 RepID=A0A2C9D9Z0_9HYPH|nr:FtsH protease activity modulator HflK [Hartmannibacter diazotrophicus]SON56415.1 Modulator of FtsH protease HflK [Hartmannibacter diazotrophicus]
MPWSNQSGGGGRGGGNGPWGQPPRGGGSGGGGQQPPDLEELLRRSQDKLRQVLPGGSGGSSFAMLPLVLLVAVGFWLYQSIYVVQPDEVGIELQFGKVKKEINGPGMHFIVWPFETVEKPQILKENQETIGGGRSSSNQGNIMLASDQNLVDVKFTVNWKIDDPIKYLFQVADQPGVVRIVSEAAMREYVAVTPAETVRTAGRTAGAVAVRDLIQTVLDSYDAGIRVTAVNLEQALPPADVRDAFDEVVRAEQDRERFQQEAQAYSNKRLGDARGQASQVREAAIGYRDQVIAEATGEAQRFTSIYDQYRLAPDVTRKRMYLETMEDVFGKSNKVIIDSGTGNSGVIPYLPLPAMNNATKGAN